MRVNFISFIFLLFPILSFSQFTLTGQVKSVQNEAVPYASLWIKSQNMGVIADVNGRYELGPLEGGSYVVEVNALGNETKTVEVLVQKDLKLDIQLEEGEIMMGGIMIESVRASEDAPFTTSELDKEDLKSQNLGQDMPYFLKRLPNVIVHSDAGAGVGYSGMRIRGVDPTRINVTLNGIPLNDPESHGVWWVNMPDFASSVENLQVQRGVGSSTNGPGAFGASINLVTEDLDEKPYFETQNIFGSFNTRKHNVKFGSGKLKNRFAFNGRLSHILSDGYIDRASSNLKSYFLSGGYYGDNWSLKYNTFSGKEKTYQAWYGVPQDSLGTNRTYNPYSYENEIDNYSQTHHQLQINFRPDPRFSFSFAGHYTLGKGYYEQFRDNDDLSNYGYGPLYVGGDTISSSDLIRRRWLDNDFFGFTYGVKYNPGPRLNLSLGGGNNLYLGRHFGEIIWAQFAGDTDIGEVYYDNLGKKNDNTVYLKANYYLLSNLNFYGDVQYRNIGYQFEGIDNEGKPLDQAVSYHFFNPKLGLSLKPGKYSRLYASFGIGNREPTRSDFVENPPSTQPKAERLKNLEAGYGLEKKNFRFDGNLYWMDYKDQLVLSGKINDVGAYIRENVNKSYRLGIELEAMYALFENKLGIGGSVALSRNIIPEFTEFIDNYDVGGQDMIMYKNTPISFSPSVVLNGMLSWNPIDNLNLSVLPKYVGRQFLDNTGSLDRSLDPYFYLDLQASYSFFPEIMEELRLNLNLNNLSNSLYSPNGYTYGWIYGGERTSVNFHYPQAGINILGGVTLRF